MHDRRAPVVLTGLPGSGKSTVGRALAARLGFGFVDLDREVERAAGRRIPEIFAAEGEAGFRARELDATRELVGRTSIVVASGGGWVTQQAAVELLRPPATLVFLDVSVATAIARLDASGEARPLLSGPDPEAKLKALFEARRSAYEAADLAVNAERVVGEVVTECERRLVSRGEGP